MSAPYYLAVDVRAKTTTAAVAEGPRLDAIRTSGALFEGGGTVPTAVFVAPDDLVFGDQALVRGNSEPDRLVYDFVSRVGDPTAVIVVDGEEFSPADLYAWMIDAVVTRVAQLRDAPARGIWAVVPASWGDDRIDAIAAALDRDGHPEVDFITVPEALASRYSQVEPFDADLTLLICDVDERELAAAVVRATPQGHSRPIGAPILALVSLDGADQHERAVDSVVNGLGVAGVDIDDVDAIILSGVSGRLGYIEQLLVDRFGDPIGTDPQPVLASALGAALALAREETALRAAAGTAMAVRSGATHTVASAGRGAGGSKWYRRPAGVVALSLAAVVLAGGAFASVFVLGAGASAGGDAVGRSASAGTATASDDGPLPTVTPSAAPQPTTSPDAAPTEPGAGEVDPPQAPANPRVPNSTAPRAPTAPVAEPEPPAATSPPAAPDPGAVVPEPTTEPEPTPTPDPEPTPTPTPTLEPTPTPAPTSEPTSSPTPAPSGEGEPPAAP